MTLEFGTDGVRGTAFVELTPEFVALLGRAAGTVLGANGQPGRPPTCVIGRDTRESSPALSAALAAGIASSGVEVTPLGVIPTAGVAVLARESGAALGAVVSASHNPASDNGVKFFGHNGQKLSESDERDIIAEIELSSNDMGSLGGADAIVGGAAAFSDEDPNDCRATFERLLLSNVTDRLDGLRVVVDSANGAASSIGPRVLAAAGAQVESIFDEPDGLNINDGCGAMSPAALAEAVVESGADLGVAFDGDADRCVLIDEAGNVRDGDHILAICALDLHARGGLRKDAIVATVMSNYGLKELLESHGIGVVECRVGDRNVLNTLDESGLVLGGEQSGHVIFRDVLPTGCGILTALQVCQIRVRESRPMSEIAGVMPTYPQKLVNLVLRDRAALDAADDFWAAVSSATDAIGDCGRVVVRPSGTEPKLRIMVQAEHASTVDEVIARLTESARGVLGE